MGELVILCIDSDKSCLNQLQNDLSPLSHTFKIELATSLDTALNLVSALQMRQADIALVIFAAPHFTATPAINQLDQQLIHPSRKIFLTTEATTSNVTDSLSLQVDAVITKPWKREQLLQKVIDQATGYVITHCANPLGYAAVLDQPRIIRAHIDKQVGAYQQDFIDYSQLSEQVLAKQVIDGLNAVFEKEDTQQARRTYSNNHILTREGTPNHFLWLIISGRVVLKKRNSLGEETDVITLDAGSLVGGMSFMTNERAFTTGVTLERTEVIKMDKTLFSLIMSTHTDLLPAFTNLLLRHFTRRNQHTISTEIKLQETLASLEEAYKQLIESEKMAVLGQLVAGVAHELNNPISAIIRGTETLKSQIPTLIQSSLSDENKQLGNKVLTSALTCRPLSTQEIRTRAKALQQRFDSASLAKKVVAMDLDTDTQASRLLEKQLPAEHLINELDRYHQVGKFIRNIDVCAKRIADLVKGLKHYAGSDTEQNVSANLLEGIEETLVIFENKLKQYRVIKEYEPLPAVECHPIALQQVWTNIISNAIDATKGKGQITIQANYLAASHEVQIVFEDDGPGIPQSLQQKIFELNFTTKREGNFGLGIGLTVCHQIINQHHGRIRIESNCSTTHYTRFIITLPVKQQPRRYSAKR